MTDVSYVPGDRTAVVGDRCWVLIDAAADSAAVQEIWQRMEQSSSLDALLSSLLRVGLGHVPGFALLAADDGRRHVICRGDASATLITDGSHERVDGTELATWREHPVAADVACVILGDPPAAQDLQLPAAAGVFLAHSVIVALVPAPCRPAGGASPAPPPAVPERGTTAGATPGPLPTDPAANLGPAASASDARVTVSHPAAAGWVPDEAVPVMPDSAGHGDAVAGPAEDTGYDFLFAATQARTIEGAAVRPVADTEAEGDLPSPFPVPAPEGFPVPAPEGFPVPAPEGFPVPAPEGFPVPAPEGFPVSAPEGFPSAAPAQTPPDPPAPAGLGGPVGPSGLIDAVPWASGPDDVRPASPTFGPADPRPPAPGPAAAPDADNGLTVKRSDLLKLASTPALPDRIGPTVHAVLCPSAHANPPSSPSCRVCGAPLPEQDPVTVPRPVLGVLRLSTGDVVTLDRGVIMGRNPGTDFAGDERPHVIKLPSGDGEISRTHVQISLDGWHVLVTDLKSTNGTLVALPGRDPEQLRSNEPLPIQPGTVVTLADGIDFRYEVAQ
jgi:FHA domain